MSELKEREKVTTKVDDKSEVPQFYNQLFSEWKSNEEPYERMIKEILLNHFLPDEID